MTSQIVGEATGSERIYVNIKYLLSSRFISENQGKNTAIEQVFTVIKTYVLSVKSEILLSE